VSLFVSLCALVVSVRAGDIVHDDDRAPKKPGCENDFILVSLMCSNSSFYSAHLKFC